MRRDHAKGGGVMNAKRTTRGIGVVHRSWLAALVLGTLFACVPFRAAAAENGPTPGTLDGRYALNDVESQVVFVRRWREDMYLVAFPGQWEGVALVDGNEFWGAFHHPESSSDRGLAGSGGTWRGTIDEDGKWSVHGEYVHGRSGKFDQRWVLKHRTPPADSLPPKQVVMPRDTMPKLGAAPAREVVARDPSLPKPGEYVQVEELPEALTKMPPTYPDDARRRGISGTVTVQALVGREGKVLDAYPAQSVPGLDEAATDCVMQWTFKPAKYAGKPVAVWVTIPVKFTLH